MSVWAAWDDRRRVFAVAAILVATASVLYAIVLRTVLFGDHAVTAIDDFGEAVAAFVACAACAWASTRATGGDRLGWTLMAVSTALWGAGELVWSYYEVLQGVQVPYPSLADAGFLAAVPFAVAGIRAFWGPPRGTSASWRIWFDGLIVAIALVSTAWGFGLRTVWESGSPTLWLDLAYPVSDIVIGTVLILAIRRATEQQKGRMALLLAGIACYSIADSAFAYLTAEGSFGSVGNVIDTGWFAGFLLIALAAIYPAGAPRPAAKGAPLDLWQLALPWMTLLTAAGGDFYTALTGHEAGLLQPSMTVILAILLTVNMLLERREFLEMLNDIQTSHSTLEKEFKGALGAIQRVSKLLRDGERNSADEVRRLAADIHREAERLDQMIEAIVEEDDGEEAVAAPLTVAVSGAR